MTYHIKARQDFPPTLKQAIAESGKVSAGNSKMPGTTFPLSAKHCNVGGKLAKIEGSVCHKCYALKLQNLRPKVDQGWTANKANHLIATDPERWINWIAFQILRQSEKTGIPEHRWFDSGDLQSMAMLDCIVAVARKTPHVKHWLPTREAKLVKAWKKANGKFPRNLVVRLSSTMIGDSPMTAHTHTSTVHRETDRPIGHVCPASLTDQDGKVYSLEAKREIMRKPKSERAEFDFGHCGNCRACWNPEIPNVTYPLH
jgi:hypothetical protein